MNRVYVPSSGPHEWQWLLASPARHWKHPHSAMALAETWEGADGWPPAVRQAIGTHRTFEGSTLLLGIPEHDVRLPGGRSASQTDLFVLARTPENEIAAIAVEGKAGESFGDASVAGWRAGGSEGRPRASGSCSIS